MEVIKRIDIAEFRSGGYLQEVNRRILHPLGLALEATFDADGSWSLGGVWDYRYDPEGINYVGVDLRPYAAKIADEEHARFAPRVAALGYWIQDAD